VGGRRIAILAFDLHHSNLPLQIAFPILIANLANWLAPTSAVDIPALAEGAATLRPGMPVVLRPQVGTDQIVVRAPSGRTWTFSVESSDPIPFAETYELGIYTVEQRGEEKTVQTQFAVNLFSNLESHIGPRDAVAVGTSQVQPQVDLIGRQEWWRWAALAALFVLIAEWIVYWQVRSPPVRARPSRN
jgi:Ca-activated chloride channel family protein